jgi:hypothetical protein
MINYFQNLSTFLIKNGIIDNKSKFRLSNNNPNEIKSISKVLTQLLQKSNPKSKNIKNNIIRIINSNI